MTETERQSALAEHACRQQASIQEGLRAGTIPGDLARVLENLDPRDKAGWREILQLKFTHKVAQGRDWMRPNRRHFARGLYLPSKRSAGYCVPCVAIDTSGSISQSNIDELISELLSMVEVINDLGGEDPEFQVAYCDSRIHEIEVVSDVHTIKPKGGGGTDFAPIMGAVLDGRLKGDFLVYLTDGECNSFGEDPGIPVVWMITTGGSRRFNPPFGEVTFLED